MTRPALIVGLGGTGQWILTYLKKDLIESNGGQLPANVKLLSFDTMPQASAATDSATVGDKQKGEEIKVGSVHLETGTEFIHIGGDMHPLGETLTQGGAESREALPHIGAWFAASHWMHTLPRASWVLAAGAGQLRQFGRLGLFQDLSDPGRSAIWNRIDVAARALERNLQGQRLEIIVVGSFAGGTGSGMFIDIGLLLRERTKAVNSLIRGYFALPRVFDQDPDDDMKARSFAAWRELNRFMTVSPNFPMPSLIYNPGNERLQIQKINKKVYDACYLIDGKQGSKRIDAEPEKIVFPAVADAISALLDDTAGNAYTEWVVANLAPEYAAKPGVALYSAVGAHSFKVPVYYAQQEFAHQLTANLLDTLVRPVRDDPQNPNRITRVSATSPFSQTRIGRDDALDLLTKDFNYQGNSEETTLFTKRIAEVLQDKGALNEALVEAYAAGSLYRAAGRGRNWLNDFTEFGNRAEIRALTNDIREIAQLRLIDSIKISKDVGEDPRQGPTRFARNIPEFSSRNYGGRSVEGADMGGRFGDALEKARQIQIDIFRRNGQLWLLKTLMGEDIENVMAGKSGRIGYISDALDGLVAHFSQFLSFLAAVEEKRRGSVQPRLKAEDQRNRRKVEMEQQVGRKIVGLFTAPQAHTSQERYLQAEQLVIDVRKDELLHRAVESTIKQMQAIADELRSEVWRWIQMLATGDPATGIVGLYQALETSQTAVRNTANADANIISQTTVKGPDYRQDTTELTRLLRAVTWRMDPNAEKFQLTLSIEPTDEPPTRLDRATGQERADLRVNLTQRNLAIILDYAKRRYSQLPGETRIAQKLAEEYGFDGSRFVDALADRAESFFARTQIRTGGAAKWARLMRISMDRSKLEPRTFEFVQNMQKEMRRHYGVDTEVRDQDRLVEVVGSADLHKCTMVFTDDLYDVKLFEAWEECQAAYLRNPKYPPHLNHNFPAETNAAQLELELSRRRNTQYRVFHPWVVMLLEYRERFEQFLLCKALGWIKHQNDGARDWYELQLPKDAKRGLMLTEPAQGRTSLFHLMHAYVLVGQDQAPRAARKIEYDTVARAIVEEERLLGTASWVDLLNTQIEALADGQIMAPWITTIIDELDADREAGRRLDDEPANYREAYEDLAEVAALLIEKRIDEKGQQTRRRGIV